MTEPRKPRELVVYANDDGTFLAYPANGGKIIPPYMTEKFAMKAREVMEDEQICNLCSHDNTANALECSNLEEKLDRTQRALEKAKEGLMIYDKADEKFNKSRVAKRILEEIEAIERGEK